MKLTAPTREDVEQVRRWRNEYSQSLRTQFLLTEEMQQDFYENVICNRDSKHRYFSVVDRDILVGFGGITNIQWENGTGEMSLIIDHNLTGNGYGTTAFDLLLSYAFGDLRLETVTGEAYQGCKEKFCRKMVDKYSGYSTILPKRKYYNGDFRYSFWYSIDRRYYYGAKNREAFDEIDEGLRRRNGSKVEK